METARMVLLIIVGFCAGSIVVGSAAMSAASHTTTMTSTQFSVGTSYSTVTQTQVQPTTVTSTQLTTTTATQLSTLTSTSTAYDTSTLTSVSTSSVTATATITQTSTVTQSNTVTRTVTSTTAVTATTTQTTTVTTTSTSTSTQPPAIFQLSGESDQTSQAFQVPSGSLTIEVNLMAENPSNGSSLSWTIVQASNFNPVDSGTFAGLGAFSTTVSSLVPGTQYEIEIFSTNTIWNLAVYQAN